MLLAELDDHIRKEHDRLEALGTEIDRLRTEISDASERLRDALRLYESLAGEPHEHALGSHTDDDGRPSPRLDMVISILDRRGQPTTLDELVAAMPDSPERGAVSAAVHRAIKKGKVRALKRGTYETIGG